MQDPNHDPPTPGCIAAILPAAGSGKRFASDENKLFAVLADQPLWYHAASRLRQQSLVGRIVMAVNDADRGVFESRYADLITQLDIELVLGGAQRTDSVRAGLETFADDESIRYVAVHDAARPLVSQADLAAVFAVVTQSGAAILATPVPGTVKRSQSDGSIDRTVDRRDLWLALTPQVFRIDLLREAYAKYCGRPATDDAELVERRGHAVTLVRGSADNIKITNPEDLLIAEAILKRQSEYA
ncbi:MAG: 2-C-methyl-D-erythritol 4-phosphate cytidylyltransferase [Pirellulaceae bacterium]|nr:2-C-methyl-D-erythritol 4-phosphate cytidylyltransferase [Pirellulaceae bacterium]